MSRRRCLWMMVLALVLSVVPGWHSLDVSARTSGGKRVVVVYSPNNPEVNIPVIKEFQDRYGIEVQLITAPTGELMRRIAAESANPLGDVFYGGGHESHDGIKQYLEPYVSPEAEFIHPEFLDPDGVWTPQFIFPQVIMYNKELVPEDEVPRGWADLLDPKWKGKIAFADPNRSGSSYAQLVTMLTAFGKDDERGWDFIKQFVANLDGKILSSSTMVHRGVADKEFYFGITPEDNPLRYIQNGANVGIIYPIEGTSARSDGNSIIKGAKNMEEAKLFIDFIASRDVHMMGQREFLRRSVRKDVEPIEGAAPTEELVIIPYDAEWATDNKDEVLRRFNRIITGQD